MNDRPDQPSISDIVSMAPDERADAIRQATELSREAAEVASEAAHARGFQVNDGREGEPLPKKEVSEAYREEQLPRVTAVRRDLDANTKQGG